MFRTLTSRLVLSYLALTIALFLLVFHILSIAMMASLDRAMETLLGQLVDRGQTFDEALADLSEKDYSVEQFYFRLYDGNGRVAIADGLDQPAAQDLAVRMQPGENRTDTLTVGPRTTLRLVSRKLDDGATLQAGVLLDNDQKLFGELAQHWWMGVLGLALPTAVLAWWMAHGAMRGVRRVTRTAEEILAGSLKARVPERQQVIEVQELTATINRMLDKIDTLVTDLQFVTVDVAHDFRSPLTRIRSAAEIALRGADSPETYRDLAVRAIEETTRLEEVLETMLEIVRLDSGRERDQRENLDLAELVREVAELYSEAAESQGVTLSSRVVAAPSVVADRIALQRAVANLVDNALKFTPDGGTVEVGVESYGEDHVVLFVEDSGPGVPEADRPKIFERFYRADASRQKSGHGLGLSYVKAAVKANGGRVAVTCPPQGGSRFEIRLPVGDRNG
ncbi:MAG: ATP-binding protein [Acidobacteriota bacterium]